MFSKMLFEKKNKPNTSRKSESVLSSFMAAKGTLVWAGGGGFIYIWFYCVCQQLPGGGGGLPSKNDGSACCIFCGFKT